MTLSPARRGRQRSEVADQAILSATLDLLAANGYGGLTMAAVITRAAVSSATLYRRWPTKQHLVAAALASLVSEVIDIDTGTLEGDLAALIDSIADTHAVQRDELAEHVAVELRRIPSSVPRSTRSSCHRASQCWNQSSSGLESEAISDRGSTARWPTAWCRDRCTTASSSSANPCRPAFGGCC